GGLNEATSDIFATAVEFHADSEDDVPDYLIGKGRGRGRRPGGWWRGCGAGRGSRGTGEGGARRYAAGAGPFWQPGHQ
ncbi:M4 family metallopeptidase, partial [Streptomyces albidoflavus]|uniref:M4 family metallopeptidase n=1 Tax=Streptomyces albidoflavus TaxID=1886 RepID=UPI0033A1A796